MYILRYTLVSCMSTLAIMTNHKCKSNCNNVNQILARIQGG